MLRLSVILVLIAQLLNKDYESAFLCVLTLVLFLVPSFFERRLKIEVPDTLGIIILLFIYAAEILGEVRGYYVSYQHWDTILHTVNGFLCAAIGFSLVDLLNRHFHYETGGLSPFYLALMAFCFSMTVGVLWEFFEFAADRLLTLDMQKDTVLNAVSTVMLDPRSGTKVTTLKNISDVVIVYADGSERALGLGGYLDVGLYDTMEDLFVNFIGAVVFSVIGYFHVKHRSGDKFVNKFMLKKRA